MTRSCLSSGLVACYSGRLRSTRYSLSRGGGDER